MDKKQPQPLNNNRKNLIRNNPPPPFRQNAKLINPQNQNLIKNPNDLFGDSSTNNSNKSALFD